MSWDLLFKESQKIPFISFSCIGIIGELVAVVFIREFVNETKIQFGVSRQNQVMQALIRAKQSAKAALVFNKSLRMPNYLGLCVRDHKLRPLNLALKYGMKDT